MKQIFEFINEKGVIALVASILLLAVMAIGIGMATNSYVKTTTAISYKNKLQTFYAADGITTLISQQCVDGKGDQYVDKTDSTYLSDLTWVSSSSGWQTTQQNHDVAGGPLSFDGTYVYSKGIGTSAAAGTTTVETTVYNLSGLNYTKFKSLVGHDHNCSGGGVKFFVYNATQLLAQSGCKAYGNAPDTLSCDITGVNTLSLEVFGCNSSNSCEHADWCNALVYKAPHLSDTIAVGSSPVVYSVAKTVSSGDSSYSITTEGYNVVTGKSQYDTRLLQNLNFAALVQTCGTLRDTFICTPGAWSYGLHYRTLPRDTSLVNLTATTFDQDIHNGDTVFLKMKRRYVYAGGPSPYNMFSGPNRCNCTYCSYTNGCMENGSCDTINSSYSNGWNTTSFCCEGGYSLCKDTVCYDNYKGCAGSAPTWIGIDRFRASPSMCNCSDHIWANGPYPYKRFCVVGYVKNGSTKTDTVEACFQDDQSNLCYRSVVARIYGVKIASHFGDEGVDTFFRARVPLGCSNLGNQLLTWDPMTADTGFLGGVIVRDTSKHPFMIRMVTNYVSGTPVNVPGGDNSTYLDSLFLVDYKYGISTGAATYSQTFTRDYGNLQ